VTRHIQHALLSEDERQFCRECRALGVSPEQIARRMNWPHHAVLAACGLMPQWKPESTQREFDFDRA